MHIAGLVLRSGLVEAVHEERGRNERGDRYLLARIELAVEVERSDGPVHPVERTAAEAQLGGGRVEVLDAVDGLLVVRRSIGIRREMTLELAV